MFKLNFFIAVVSVLITTAHVYDDSDKNDSQDSLISMELLKSTERSNIRHLQKLSKKLKKSKGKKSSETKKTKAPKVAKPKKPKKTKAPKVAKTKKPKKTKAPKVKKTKKPKKTKAPKVAKTKKPKKTKAPKVTKTKKPKNTDGMKVEIQQFNLSICSSYESTWLQDLSNSCKGHQAACKCNNAEMRIQNGEIDCRQHECPAGCDVCQLCLYYYNDCLWKHPNKTKKPKKSKTPKVKKTKKPKKAIDTKSPETKKSKAPKVKKTKKPKKPKKTIDTKSPETKKSKAPKVKKTKKPKKTTSLPTSSPNSSPSDNPTQNPTSSPSNSPSPGPSYNLTQNPSLHSTNIPSSPSSGIPTLNVLINLPLTNPSPNPTMNPTPNPTVHPTENTSENTTPNITVHPTPNTTPNTTVHPTPNTTVHPTPNTTMNPTVNPTVIPSPNPSMSPTNSPVEYPFSKTQSPSNTQIVLLDKKLSIDCTPEEDVGFGDLSAPGKLDLFFLYDIEYRNNAIQESSMPETANKVSDQIMSQLVASLFPECATKRRQLQKLPPKSDMDSIVGLNSNTFTIEYDESCVEPFDNQISSCNVVRNNLPVLLSQKIDTQLSDELSQALISKMSEFNFELDGVDVKSMRRDDLSQQLETSSTVDNKENLGRSNNLEISSTSSDGSAWGIIAGASSFVILFGILAHRRSKDENERSLLMNEEDLPECYDDRGEDILSQTIEASSKVNAFSICGGSFTSLNKYIHPSKLSVCGTESQSTLMDKTTNEKEAELIDNLGGWKPISVENFQEQTKLVDEFGNFNENLEEKYQDQIKETDDTSELPDKEAQITLDHESDEEWLPFSITRFQQSTKSSRNTSSDSSVSTKSVGSNNSSETAHEDVSSGDDSTGAILEDSLRGTRKSPSKWIHLEPISEAMNEAMNESMNESINDSTNESINDSTNESINDSTNGSACRE